mgnify:CR=1 FL=1
MIITKIKDFFKSFRNKVIVIIALIVVVSSLLISKYVLYNENENYTEKNDGVNLSESNDETGKIKKVGIEELKLILSPGIDSVLKNFGIKN